MQSTIAFRNAADARGQGRLLMDANKVEPESSWVPPGELETEATPASLRQASWRAAKSGFQVVSYIAGPITFVVLILGLAMTVFGVGAGRGWAVPVALFGAFGFYFVCALWGLILGAAIGMIGGLIRRGRPGTFLASRCGTASRATWLPGEPEHRRNHHRRPGGQTRTALGLAGWRNGTICAAGAGGRPRDRDLPGRAVDRRLADAIAAADRDDPNWRLDDLMAHREPVPDAENSALIVAEALALLPENWPYGPSRRPESQAVRRTRR